VLIWRSIMTKPSTLFAPKFSKSTHPPRSSKSLHSPLVIPRPISRLTSVNHCL
jgi:hypothetical protein